MSTSSREHPALVAVARHGIPIAALLDAGPAVLRDCESAEVLTFCCADRLSGVLAEAVRSGEIVCDPTGDTAERIEDDWHESLRACVLVEALLVRVSERLDEAGIRWLLSKGSAVAHLDYPVPELRTFADIDLLVHPDDWDTAVALLGADRVERRRTLEFVRRYGKGVTVLVDEMEVDLHRRFAVGRFGVRCRMEECFERTDSITLAGRRIPTPTAPFRLLHACFHAALGGNAELRAFRDVAQLALGSADTVAETWEIADSWGVAAVVAAAISETWSRLRLPSDHPVVVRARHASVGRVDRRVLDVFASDGSFRRQTLTTLTALGVREHPRFVVTAWQMSSEHGR